MTRKKLKRQDAGVVLQKNKKTKKGEEMIKKTHVTCFVTIMQLGEGGVAGVLRGGDCSCSVT